MNKNVLNENMEITSVKAVEKIIGYTFNDKSILQRALTHSSYNKMLGIADDGYERMEFLGDSILDFVVADELYHNYPQFDEGVLTKFRANIVSSAPLAEIIVNSKIYDYLLYDRSCSLKQKKISDFFEAIVAAIYLDSNGLKAIRQFILKYLKPYITAEVKNDNYDYKSMLYEFCSAKKWSVEFVQSEITGPPHDLTFTMQLLINGEVVAEASGKKKLDAEKQCSKSALIKFGEIKNEI